MKKIYTKILIIGSGPAALSMSAVLKMGNIDHMVLEKSDKIGGQINMINNSLDDLIIGNIDSGNHLETLILQFQENKNLPIYFNHEVTRLDSAENKVICTCKNDVAVVYYEFLVIATGCRLNIDPDFENSHFENDIYYRINENLNDFDNKIVAIAGSGDNAAIAALKLTDIATKIYILNRSDNWKIRSDLFTNIKESTKIFLLTKHMLKTFNGDENLRSIILDHNGLEQELQVEKFIFKIGYKPNTEFAGDKIAKNTLNHIETDQNFRTSVPNIYAIGDVISESYKRITIAMGHGTFLANHLIKNVL